MIVCVGGVLRAARTTVLKCVYMIGATTCIEYCMYVSMIKMSMGVVRCNAILTYRKVQKGPYNGHNDTVFVLQ